MLTNYCLGGSEGLIEKASTADAIQAEKQKDNAEEDLCTLQNVQIANIADGSKRNAGKLCLYFTRFLYVCTVCSSKYSCAFEMKVTDTIVYNFSRLRYISIA